nr:B12-binding domain-containing radical SAM protein [Streptomyces hokutonensis]
MSILLIAPPALWRNRYLEKHERGAYFDVQKRYLGSGAWSFPAENLAIMSIKAYAASRGIDVTTINAQTARHASIEQTWHTILESAKKNGDPLLIGFTGTAEMYEESMELALRAKRRWSKVLTVLGHDLATLSWRDVLARSDAFDFACTGDGEAAFTELARRVLNGESLAGCPSMFSRDDVGSAPVRHRNVPALNLDELPWPSRDDLPAVRALGMGAAVFSSRGCPFRCTFCTTGSKSAIQHGSDSYRTKSITNVVDEISMLHRDHGVNFVTISDDLFLLNQVHSQRRAEEFATEMIRRQLSVSFMVDCRIDSIDASLFSLLVQAGLVKVFIGVETADDDQLQNYGKVYDRKSDSQLDVIRKKLQLLHDLSLDVVPGVLTYHPRVTKRELLMTDHLIEICKTPAPNMYWTKIIAYPGTPLYADYKARGLLSGDWPTEYWHFEDPKAERQYDRFTQLISGRRSSFEFVRKTFLSTLDSWDED